MAFNIFKVCSATVYLFGELSSVGFAGTLDLQPPDGFSGIENQVELVELFGESVPIRKGIAIASGSLNENSASVWTTVDFTSVMNSLEGAIVGVVSFDDCGGSVASLVEI